MEKAFANILTLITILIIGSIAGFIVMIGWNWQPRHTDMAIAGGLSICGGGLVILLFILSLILFSRLRRGQMAQNHFSDHQQPGQPGLPFSPYKELSAPSVGDGDIAEGSWASNGDYDLAGSTFHRELSGPGSDGER